MATARLDAAALRDLADRLYLGHCWVKTKNGPRRLAEPLNAEKLAEHLAGQRAFGACPIAPGTSTCRVACLDFDNHTGEISWEHLYDVAQSVAFVLEQNDYPAHLFRSSGGKGVHLYLVWDTPQDAYSVRTMLKATLASLDLKSGTGGVVQHQVEIFPKQDAIPADGFGSMFILPGAGQSVPLTPFVGWQPAPSVPVCVKPERETPVPSATPEISQLRSALAAIPNDTAPLEYDDWRDVVFALHYATNGGPDGLALAHEFSARAPQYNPDFLDNRVWPYVGLNSAPPITQRTLFAHARRHGWVDPAVLDDFEVLADEEKPPRASRFKFVQAAQFCAGKPLGWLIKNVLPRSELVVLYGETGAGKSFLALDLIGAMVQGLPWRGHKTTAGLRCGYIAAEGASGVRNRLAAYALHHGVDLSSLPLFVLEGEPNFMEKADITDLIVAMKEYGPLDLLVVDTFAQVTAGANENSGEDMGRAISHCKALHRATGGTVALVHHSGKDASRGARGWSGLKGAVDAELEVTRDHHDRTVTITKLKDGTGEGTRFGFKLLTVPLGLDADGEIYGSCVVEHVEAVTPVGREVPKGKHEIAVHKIVVDLIQAGQVASVAAIVEEYTQRVPVDPTTRKDTRRQNAERALRALLDKEILLARGTQIFLPGVSAETEGDLSLI